MNRRKYLIVAVVLTNILGTFFLITFHKFKFAEKTDNSEVKLTDKIDPDIVLINLEEGDRSFIGNLLLKIDSCNPTLIAIDGWFENEKHSTQDSVLMHALKNIQNDILGYSFDSTDKPVYSHPKFMSLVSGNGSLETLYDKEMAVAFIPLETSENKVYEHFTLEIIKHWKPNFKHSFEANQIIPINYSRTLNQYVHFNGSQLKAGNCKELKNKIVLIGYLGASDEDKHFTPIRYVRKYDAGEPDTYGLVIIANELRTIIEYEK
jgi:hypothetical protein